MAPRQSLAPTTPEPGAAESFEAAFRDHYDFVWRNARRLGCSGEWVEDAVQEVFLVVERKLPEFEGRSSLRTWLFAITYRVVQRLQRDRKRYARHLGEIADAQDVSASAPATGETRRTLNQLLSRLDEAKRVAFILVELEGMSSREVSELLGVPSGTIDSRLRAARKQLGRMIEQDSTVARSGVHENA